PDAPARNAHDGDRQGRLATAGAVEMRHAERSARRTMGRGRRLQADGNVGVPLPRSDARGRSARNVRNGDGAGGDLIGERKRRILQNVALGTAREESRSSTLARSSQPVGAASLKGIAAFTSTRRRTLWRRKALVRSEYRHGNSMRPT